MKAEIEDAEERLARANAIAGPIPSLIIQGVNRQLNLQSYVGKTVGQIAEEEGKHYIDAMLDLSIAGDLNVEFLGPERGSNATNTGELITRSPYTFPGISDGGAHTKYSTTGNFGTLFLTSYVREHGWLSLEDAHWRLSALPAHFAGLEEDLGTLVIGAPADIVVYDYDKLDISEREKAYDYPAGEWRVIDHGVGYRWVLANGQVTIEDDKQTDVPSGRVVNTAKSLREEPRRAA
jgi:N-acyl-D-aspartate/D-glutamate deacylase